MKKRTQIARILGIFIVFLGLTLYMNRNTTEGFQTTLSLPLSGFKVLTTIDKVKTYYNSLPESDTDKASLRVVDLTKNEEISLVNLKNQEWVDRWNKENISGSTQAPFLILNSSVKTITLPVFGYIHTADSQAAITFKNQIENTFGPILEYVKLQSNSSYINALSGTSIVELDGARYKIDTSKYYPLLSNVTDDRNIYDSATKTLLWKKGDPIPSPSGIKEVDIINNTTKLYTDLNSINSLIVSENGSPLTTQQLLYPVRSTGNTGEYTDARTPISYTSKSFKALSGGDNINIPLYAGIGAGVVVVILFIIYMSKGSQQNSKAPA